MKYCKAILAAALIAAIVAGVGIYAHADSVRPESLARAIEEEEDWRIGRMGRILSYNLNMPLKELPTRQFFYLNMYTGRRYIHPNLSSIGSTLRWFTNSAKVAADNIQKIDSEHIAVVYKVAQEGIPEAYMFVVFQRVTASDPAREVWEKTGEAYFFDRLHSFAEFSDIAVGQKVDVLYNIDSSIRYDVLRDETSMNYYINDENWPFDDLMEYDFRMVYKLLSDGILLIEYKASDMLITEISFYPYSESADLKYISMKDPAPLACLAEIDK